MSDTKTKTERLLLNTTPEERVGLKSLLERSRHSSNSDLMREAFEQYLAFHKRVLGREEIIVCTMDGKGGHSIYIPVKWEDSAYTDIDQNSEVGVVKEAPARKVLEIRLSPDLKKKLQQFVASGYAPSLTALAGGALEIHAEVLTAGEEGNEIRARRADGSEVVLIEPRRRMSAPAGIVHRESAPVTGFSEPPKKDILKVLDEERNLHPVRFVVDAPILTGERHEDVAAKVEEAVLANLREGTSYIYILDEKEDMTRLAQWLHSKLEPRIAWDDIVPAKRPEVEAIKDYLTGQAHERAKKSPAWCLIRAGIFPAEKLSAQKRRTDNKDGIEEMLGRMFNFACWYAEMEDGRVWGFQFTSTGKLDPLSTFLTPMCEETVREQFQKLKQYGESKVLVPETMAANVTLFSTPLVDINSDVSAATSSVA